jgi:hypothetical protein
MRIVIVAACTLVATLAGVAEADNLVVNPSFETGNYAAAAWPSGLGYWGGDQAAFVTFENGIAPLAGDRMLRFDFTAFSGPDPVQVASDVFSLIDLDSVRDLILSGVAVASAEASFNRVAGDDLTDNEFSLRVLAYDGLPADFPLELNEWIARSDATLFSDSDVTTWEAMSVEMLVPANTYYLAVYVAARENVFNNGDGLEFDGHYCDEVSLEVRAAVPVQESTWAGVKAIFR